MIAGLPAAAPPSLARVIDDLALPSQATSPAIIVVGPQVFPLVASKPDMARFALSTGYALEVDAAVVGIRITQDNRREAVAEVAAGTMLSLNGEPAGRFAGTTSLRLSDAMVVTMETALEEGDRYRLERVTVTEDNRAMLISGFPALKVEANATPSPILVTQSFDGAVIDEDTRDGFTLELGSDGRWVGELGERVTAELLAQTELGRPYGPNSTLLSYGEWGRLLSRLIATTIVWSNIAAFRTLPQPETRASDHDRSAREAAIRRAFLLQEIERAAALRAGD